MLDAGGHLEIRTEMGPGSTCALARIGRHTLHQGMRDQWIMVSGRLPGPQDRDGWGQHNTLELVMDVPYADAIAAFVRWVAASCPRTPTPSPPLTLAGFDVLLSTL